MRNAKTTHFSSGKPTIVKRPSGRNSLKYLHRYPVNDGIERKRGRANRESTGRFFWKLVQTMRSKVLAHFFAVALTSEAMMKWSGSTPSFFASDFFESLEEMA